MGLKVQYGRSQTKILNRFNAAKGADVASASTLSLGSDGNFFDITGTTTVNRINPTSWTAGACVTLQFDGALTITHNAGTDTATAVSILLATNTSKTTIAGDVLTLVYDGANFVEVAAAWQNGAPQVLSGAGAIGLTTRTTLYTSTGGSQALTLADGAHIGQRKTIIHAVDGGSGVITAGGSLHLGHSIASITFTAVREWVELEWDGTNWNLVAMSGVTVA